MSVDNTNSVIDVNGITKSFTGNVVVDQVSLRINRGEIFGFLGPNGSGKTTFLRILCGLLLPDAGSGYCLGFDVLKQSSQIKKHVGYMTQKFSLYEELTIEENLLFIARLYGVEYVRVSVENALESLGLQHRRKQLAGHLSGGWKQRLALAACLIHRPELLLLDEPTAGVDPKARREFWDELHHLTSEGMTVLITTHYMDEAERCDRLAYISLGRLLTTGTPEQLISEANLVTWEIRGARITEIKLALQEWSQSLFVAAFGGAVHVSCKSDFPETERLRQVLNQHFVVRSIPTSLEHVLINLMH